MHLDLFKKDAYDILQEQILLAFDNDIIVPERYCVAVYNTHF